MDTNVIREGKEIRDDKEKSKDVFQRKGEDLNLDCIYDNSPNVLRIKKDGISGSFKRD